MLIIDEAQNLPLQVLEQLRILSNLETDKEKLLQIIMVGQLNLQTLLRSPELRQLDQRVSIRYQLKPLTRDEMAAYIAHRLHDRRRLAAPCPSRRRRCTYVHQFTGGIPRLINLVCDRSLLGAFSARVEQGDARTGRARRRDARPAAGRTLAFRMAAAAAPRS